MTDTQKRLEEFNELMDKLWDKYGESYEVYNPKEFAREIESFLATSIDQAIAEERKRVVGDIEKLKEYWKPTEGYGCEEEKGSMTQRTSECCQAEAVQIGVSSIGAQYGCVQCRNECNVQMTTEMGKSGPHWGISEPEQAEKEAAEATRLDTLKKAQEDEERKKLLSPDKEKLLELANMIEQIGMPAVNSKEASSVIRATEEMLGKVANYIREKAKTL